MLLENIQNLFSSSMYAYQNEVMEKLLAGESFKLERVLSTVQATVAGEWYDQAQAEWVVPLSGAERLP